MPATHIYVMTFNIENGGTQVSFDKIVDVVKQSKADIVGIQEAWGNTCRLSAALGWQYCAPSQNIISRFPLYETKNSDGKYVLAEVSLGRFIALANMHLPDDLYGPELIQKGAKASVVIANSQKAQLPTALPYVQSLKQFAKQGMPVFLTGDFNTPSHLDWTESTVKKFPNRKVAVNWPVTKMIEQAGMIDSYRKIYLDPVKHPGCTWPAGRPFLKNAVDKWNPSKQDSADRLDYIFAAGPIKVLDSYIISEPEFQKSKIKIAPWPSDHRAVVSKFEVMPLTYAKQNLKQIAQSTNGKPALTLSKKSFQSGEPIQIRWSNAPGHRYDYIRIRRISSHLKSSENFPRLYTYAKPNGTVIYDTKTQNGNWVAWNKSDQLRWPLSPGKYQIQLLSDDSETVLASERIDILESVALN